VVHLSISGGKVSLPASTLPKIEKAPFLTFLLPLLSELSDWTSIWTYYGSTSF
jgi:hypothetical protein